jgi:hypothetical protein
VIVKLQVSEANQRSADVRRSAAPLTDLTASLDPFWGRRFALDQRRLADPNIARGRRRDCNPRPGL